VLEVMCGSGRLLVPLAVDGIDIDGVDASADMLAACARKCAELGVSPGLSRQVAQDLDLPRPYALAFVTAGSFGLLTDQDWYRQALAKMFEHLGPGGLLVIDVETTVGAPQRNGDWVGRWWNRPDGAMIVSRNLGRYDSTTRVEEGLGIYELWADGVLVETELNTWFRRFWSESELQLELLLAGFTDVAIESVADGAVLVAEARRPD